MTGWFTAEVGRQPWVVYGVLRTADAITPFLTARMATISLVVFCAVYSFIFGFGVFYDLPAVARGTGWTAGPAGQPASPTDRCRSSTEPVDAVGHRPTPGE